MPDIPNRLPSLYYKLIRQSMGENVRFLRYCHHFEAQAENTNPI